MKVKERGVKEYARLCPVCAQSKERYMPNGVRSGALIDSLRVCRYSMFAIEDSSRSLSRSNINEWPKMARPFCKFYAEPNNIETSKDQLDIPSMSGT